MDINSSHLSFFKVEANKYATLCTESFYGRDYCPPETEQTPLSKPHGHRRASRLEGIPCPSLNIYFPCHSKFSPTKPQDSQARTTQVDVNIQLVEGLIYSSMETTYRSFPGNKTTPQCFQGQKLSILCLISNVLPGLKL